LELIGPILQDLKFLQSISLLGLEKPDAGAMPAKAYSTLEKIFHDFAASRPQYEQVRLLNTSGMELIRINNSKARTIKVPFGKLQNKKKRYYFRDTLKLKPNMVYASPLDLNVEHGQIELPHKPMIRFGTVVYDEKGQKKAVVIINYLAELLIKELAYQPDSADSPLFLINREGYWLKGPKPELEWGFMHPAGEGRTLKDTYGDAWEKIRLHPKGQIETPNGLFTFITVNPLPKHMQTSTGSPKPEAPSESQLKPEDYYWKIVKFTPRKIYYTSHNKWLWIGFWVLSIGAIVLAFIALRLAWLAVKRSQVEQQLKKAREELEQRVKNRTKELAQSNQSLKQEIIEKVKIQEQLQESEGRYRSMMQAMMDQVYICSSDYRIEYLNPAMEKRLGPNALGKICHEALYRSPTPCSFCVKKEIEKGKSKRIQIESPFDGRHYLVSNDPIFHKDGSISKMTIYRDITDIKKARSTIKKSKTHFQSLVDLMREGFTVMNTKDQFTFVNQSLCQMLGYQRHNLLGQHYSIIIPENAREITAHNLQKRKNGQVHPYETQIQKADGRILDVFISPAPIFTPKGGYDGSFAVVTDLTQKKKIEREKARLENQLRQAQKMEAIGTLAGGIAHDFNNILTPIIGYAELIASDLPVDSKTATYLDQVMTAANRAKELVQQILSFSRQKGDELKPLRLAPLIKEPLKLLRASLPSTIDMEQNITDAPLTIQGDPSQIHQLMMNLCTNASHAMREKGGTLSVSVEKAVIMESVRVGGALLYPGEYALLRIKDTGHGIPPKIAKKIFDPYFTTKEPEEGTGLGLAMVQGIVVGHGGGITVDSEEEKGSCFNIYLPLQINSADEESINPPEVTQTNRAERIILVDDEKSIVEMMELMLGRMGYQVTACSDSRACLEIFNEDPQGYDLLITDQTMPKITGLELAKKVHEIRPDLPIILCTGFQEEILRENSLPNEVEFILSKPVMAHEISRALRKIFEATSH
jgi:PAS domain S-box-containing protein